jgi:isoleucyl-tRNA synthetase
MPDSVHLCDFPSYRPEMRNEALEEAMAAVQTTVSLGHSLRKEYKFKVRQPLPSVHIATGDARVLHFLEDQQHLIADELNVKNVVLGSDETKFVSLKAKPNFRILGKKVGKLMRSAQLAIDAFGHDQLTTLLNGGTVEMQLEGETIVLTPEDVAVERQVREGLIAANEGLITIALDTSLTEDLLIEGLAREVVNKINTMRREGGFDVTDRIHVKIDATERVRKCFDQFGEMIKGEVLALSVDFGPCEGGTVWDLNGEAATIALVKQK